MGLSFSRLWTQLFGKQEVKIIIVGLDNAGKTTTLYKLLLGDVVQTTPTIGSNLEQIKYKNMTFNMWDLAGQEALRSSWSVYFANSQAIILVIDSSDRQRLHVIREELFKLLTHQDLMGTKLLVFANKQDIKGSMSAAEVTKALNLHKIKEHDWHIQSCCALTGEGLYQGLDWLVDKIKSDK